MSVSLSAEAEEAIGELLGRIFGQPASIHINARTGATMASVFLASHKALSTAKLKALKAGLGEIRSFGLNLGSGRILIQPVRRENWAESWKKHFPPLEIAGKLLVKPPWSKLQAKKGQRVIVLNPGLSFGTGQHPTTRFCLEELVRQRVPGKAQSCLDLGSGSGILAIAAAKLGYKPVVGVDNDLAAVRIARKNGKHNRVRAAFHCLDVTQSGKKGWGALRRAGQESGRHDLVCANLIYDLLLAEKIRISDGVKDSGVLVLAGILKGQFEAVRQAYEGCGWRLLRSRTEKEWRSGAFARESI